MWYYDSGSDTEDDEKVDRLTFPYVQTPEKSAIHHFVLSTYKEKFKEEFAALYDVINGAISDVFMFDDEIRKKFLSKFNDDDNLEEKSLLLNGLAEMLIYTIDNWKRFIDLYIFLPRNEQKNRAIDFVNCLTLSDRGMAIDYAKTARNMIAEEKVNAEDKLKIACVHCLQDEVVRLTGGRNFVELSEDTYDETKCLVNFWKMYILEDKFSEDAEQLIKIVWFHNYPGLTFFREKLTEEQRQRVIVDVMKRTDADVQTQWLHEMSTEQQELVFRECGGRVLINLMRNENWKEKIYEVAIFARELLNDEQYLEVIKYASENVPYIHYSEPLVTNDEHLEMFHFMWKRASQRTKEYIYEQDESLDFFWFLKKRQDFGFFKRFFNRAPQQWKCKFVERKEGMRILTDMYTYNEAQDLFHDVVKSTYPNEEEATEYKIRFMNQYSSTISGYRFLIKGKNATYSILLKNMFGTNEAIERFKRQYLYNGKNIHLLKKLTRSIFFHKENEERVRSTLLVKKLIQFIRVFVPQSDLENFKKTELCRNKCVKEVFLDLMKIGRYNPIEVFLKWSINDVQLVADYKRNFISEDMENEMAKFISDLVLKKDNFWGLIKFMNWCFLSTDNQCKLGDKILNQVETMLPMWRYLLNEESSLKMADDFLKLCGKEDEMRVTKNKLFLDLNLTYVLYGVKSRHQVCREDAENAEMVERMQAKASKLIQWFELMPQTYMEFIKRRFAEEGYEFKDDVAFDFGKL